MRCTQCGATLNGIAVGDITTTPATRSRKVSGAAPLSGPPSVEWHEGEADLLEANLPVTSWPLIFIGAAICVALISGAVLLVVQFSKGQTEATPTVEAVAGAETSVPTPRSTAPPTNTKMVVLPTPSLATVTPAPPTATITPTRGPCLQKVKAGDTIYGLATRCGYHDMSIVQTILDLNNMKDAGQLQIGQVLEIPWPTATGGAPEQGTANPASTSAGAVNNEPTLPAGIMWYTVKKGDDAISIAARYHMDMKTLRDLNPEMTFSGCDFGIPAGGSSCIVQVFERQRIRVVAPTPTPTLSPTPNGSETPTPTATPTYNAPFSQSPDNNAPFDSTQLPVLRWVASGELTATQVYLIRVRDVDLNVTYTMTTHELSFQVPADWAPSDGKAHTFEWSVAIASLNTSGTPVPSPLTTETRTFTWLSR